MKVRFNRWYNAVLTALLSMLGFGCSSEEPMDMYGPPVEYGPMLIIFLRVLSQMRQIHPFKASRPL